MTEKELKGIQNSLLCCVTSWHFTPDFITNQMGIFVLTSKYLSGMKYMPILVLLSSSHLPFLGLAVVVS